MAKPPAARCASERRVPQTEWVWSTDPAPARRAPSSSTPHRINKTGQLEAGGRADPEPAREAEGPPVESHDGPGDGEAGAQPLLLDLGAVALVEEVPDPRQVLGPHPDPLVA